MKKLVTYICFDRCTGRQDIIRQYIVEDESEALKSFHLEMEEDEDLEINEVDIVELTDEEATEMMMIGGDE